MIIAGGGNAGLTAAISGREAGASVVLVEAAPRDARGGNTYYTGGGFKFVHKGTSEVKDLIADISEAEVASMEMPPYSADQMYGAWMRVTKGLADPEMVETVVAQSMPTMKWLTGMGVRFIPGMAFAVRFGDKLKWQPGQVVLDAKDGGMGLSDTLFEIAEKKGVQIRYETRATKLLMDSKGKVCGLTVKSAAGFEDLAGKAVILACGGFEANREMRARYLGACWEMARIRGTRYNVGTGIKMALDVGAQPTGQWTFCHGALIDANAAFFPTREVGETTNRSSTVLGIMVNVNGQRFLDEGQDLRSYTYSRFGEFVIGQPDSMAFQIFDAKVQHLIDERYGSTQPITADTPEELAEKLEIPDLAGTIHEYNAAVQDGPFDPLVKDGKHTVGINPPKSNWAQKIDTPPLTAYPVTGGIAFTYGGVKINTSGEVLDFDDRPIPGLYAVGEMVGGLFYHNYLGGGGLMAGAVFGRIAGAEAAAYQS